MSTPGDFPPLPKGRIKTTPEDFIVEELPLYEPSGHGDHLFVRFEKRGLTTDEAVRALAHAAGVRPQDVGVAGLKDRVGVTTQTVSLPLPPGRKDEAGERLRDALARAESAQLRILSAQRHPHKLRTGHLAGNRFQLVVREVAHDRAKGVCAALASAAREGVPNLFGPQRFGLKGDNPQRALAFLHGRTAPPRDGRLARLLFSSVQAAVFNAVVTRRQAEAILRQPQVGDWLQKRDTGGLFLCTDAAAERARADAAEVVTTGPMPGSRGLRAEGAPGRLEREEELRVTGQAVDWERFRSLGEGTRRPLTLWVSDLGVEVLPSDAKDDGDSRGLVSLRVRFVLPRGAYATTVLGVALAVEDGPR